MSWRLMIRSGGGADRTIELGAGRTSIGRAPTNAVVLNDPSVSSRHCEIFSEGERTFLRDLHSSNGTLVNGRLIELEELHAGDTIVIGESRIEVRLTPAPATGLPPPGPSATQPIPAVSQPVLPAGKPAPAAGVAPSPAIPRKPAAAIPIPLAAQALAAVSHPAPPADEPKPPIIKPVPPAPVPPVLAPEKVLAPAPAPGRSAVQPPGAVGAPSTASARLSALTLDGIGASVAAAGQDTAIFDKRAVIIGVGIAILLAIVGCMWTLKANLTNQKMVEKDFEFSVAQPKVEDVPQIREPIREILQERTMEEQTDNSDQLETPNIQISTAPVEVREAQMVIRSPNVSIDTPVIDVSGTELEIQDAPMEIAAVADTTSYALDVIAQTVSGPADFYQHTEPVPPGKMQRYTFAQAPRPGKPLKNMPKAFGDQNAATGGKLGAMDINLFGNSEHFFRAMEASVPIQNRQTVDSALQWLALHQDPDGTWKCEKYEGVTTANLAMTGFGALAFMGGGSTLRKGEYQRNVVKAVEAIMHNQNKKDGGIGLGYTHAICTIALCEAYGRANDERVGRAAQQAVNCCEKTVARDGGWRYGPNPPQGDMSVSSWYVQALKTAKLAQIKFDHSIFSQALIFVDSCTHRGAGQDSSGGVCYMAGGIDDALDDASGSPALTCAAMVIRQFNGMGVKNHILVKGAEFTKTMPPDWKRKNFYCWYYATYAMHNMGGEYRIWWSQRIMNMLRENQVRQGEHIGSWDPKGDAWGAGGRVWATAIGALCMEVGYRYSDALNSFGTAPDIEELFLK